jgi:hypothetical protein
VPFEPADGRLVRIEHAVAAVLAFGGFVFRFWYTVPLAALVLFGRSALGPELDWFARLPEGIARLVPVPRQAESWTVVRRDALLEGAGFALASLLLATNISAAGWLVALVVGAIAAVRAATGASLARLIARVRR